MTSGLGKVNRPATRVGARTLARSPSCDPLSEGFGHFVTSMTVPVASGWSGCRVGLARTGKRRLITAHTEADADPPATTFGDVGSGRSKGV